MREFDEYVRRKCEELAWNYLGCHGVATDAVAQELGATIQALLEARTDALIVEKHASREAARDAADASDKATP